MDTDNQSGATTMRGVISTRLAAMLIMCAIGLGVGMSRMLSADDIYGQLNKIKDVLVLSEKYHVDEVDTEKLVDGAITGMVEALDPHSVYFPARSFEKVAEEMSGKFQGVGLQIRSFNDTIIVVEPIGGGPSARLGILSNDRVVMVNDTSIVGMSSADAAKRLRGPKGTKVKVTIVRSGVKEALLYEITRDDIALYSVDAAIMMPENTGYISVNRFNAQTNDEMMKALTKLKGEGMKRLVLDLRSNPGGILQQAVMMADLFLDGGSPKKPRKIVYTKARRQELSEEFLATSGQPYENLPLIILLSNQSASASEIVAGAIQDWDRGLVVGETSFGKGLVQREWPIPGGGAFRLTIARYFTPSGRLIQRPYDGKSHGDYVSEAFTREEEEGENIDHQSDVRADTTRPKFQTNAGRTVYGGGGITPDYFVRSLKVNEQTQTILRRDLMYQYITSWLDGKGSSVRETYGSDMARFVKSFSVTAELMDEFKTYAQGREIKIDENQFAKDAEFMRARFKAYIARSIWGLEGWSSVMLHVDPQYQRAVSLFPEAVKLIAAG